MFKKTGENVNNNLIFQKFWEEYIWPEPAKISYRLYYDDHGMPLSYSMEDLPGKYIEITAEQYQESSPHVRVKDGQLIKLSYSTTKKLVPADYGTACHPENVAVIAFSDKSIKWKIKQYDNS